MECSRCGGLMVVDHYIDMQNSGDLWLRAWRCVACGDVMDPEILRQRQRRRAQAAVAAPEPVSDAGDDEEVETGLNV